MDRPKTPGIERPHTPYIRPKTPGSGLSDRPKTPGAGLTERPKTPGASLEPAQQYFQVFLRLRPTSPHSETRFLTTAPSGGGGQCTYVYVTPPGRTRARSVDKYSFTKVFGEASEQREVFIDTVLPLVTDAIRGRDGLLATLGVTGSGKTYTVLGDRSQRGIIQLALDVLFRSLAGKMVDYTRMDLGAFDYTNAVVLQAEQFFTKLNAALELGHAQGSKRSSIATSTPNVPDASDIVVESDAKCGYAVLMSMYELYNDRIFDLLDETPLVNPAARRKALIFKGSATQGRWDAAREQKKVVAGLRKVCVSTYAEALQVVEHAQTCRKVSATNLNLSSSRSHAFLQIEIKRFSSRGVERESSSLHIVDLAGSERARSAQTAGSQLAEAGSINRSLMTLGQCLASQQPGSSTTANWRNSKLTEVLFSNTFSGVAPRQKASMIVAADPMGDYNATLQILKYSALAREVTIPHRPAARNIFSPTMPDDDGEEVEPLAPAPAPPRVPTPAPSRTDSARERERERERREKEKDTLIAQLRAQLATTESRARDAEERCLHIEVSVRDELAEEMDRRLDAVRREARAARQREAEWRDEFVDEKIEILRKGMEDELKVFEDGEREAWELREENEVLKKEVAALRRELRGKRRKEGREGREGREKAVLGGVENKG